MAHSELLRFTLRALLGWTILSVLAFVFREPLGRFLLPLVEFGLRELNQDFSPGLKLVAKEGDYLISLSAWVLRPIPIIAGQIVNPGAQMTAGTHLTHTLVPPVISLSLILAWPIPSLLQRVIACGLCILLSFLAVTVTVPLVLLGNLEIMFQNVAANAGQTRPAPFSLDAMIFLESGGRWLLAVAAALLCMPLSGRLTQVFRKPNLGN